MLKAMLLCAGLIAARGGPAVDAGQDSRNAAAGGKEAGAAKGEAMEKTIYAFRVKDAEGEEYSLAGLKGKVVLIVNVASKCGFTARQAAGWFQGDSVFRDGAKRQCPRRRV